MPSYLIIGNAHDNSKISKTMQYQNYIITKMHFTFINLVKLN